MNKCFGRSACPVAQRLYPVALGGMVSGGDEADAVLPRAVHGLLGNLAGQVGIDASGDRLVDIAPAPPVHQAMRRIG